MTKETKNLQFLEALFIILVGDAFCISCQSSTLVWMHNLKFKYSSDSSVQHISWQGCSLFWFSHLSGKVIDLWLSDRRIKWAAATNKQRVLFMSVSNFYCYSYKSELTMHRTHIEQIRWSSPKHRQGQWKLEEFGWANPELSQKCFWTNVLPAHLCPLSLIEHGAIDSNFLQIKKKIW